MSDSCCVWCEMCRSVNSHVGGEDAVDEVLLGQVEGALQLVVVERDLSGAWAVQPGLHERGPRVLQEKASPDVVLTDPGHAGIHRLPAVVLHRVLPQEEEGEEADVVGGDEVRLCREKKGTGSLHTDSRAADIFATFIFSGCPHCFTSSNREIFLQFEMFAKKSFNVKHENERRGGRRRR